MVLASRNGEALRQLADEIRGTGGKAVPVVADVGDPDDVARIAKTALQEYGRFDTWVNVAGIDLFGRLDDLPLQEMRRTFDTTFWGVVHGCREAVRHLRERTDGGGAVINVGSVFGDRSAPLQGTYASAKFAVRAFTDALRVELAKEGAPIAVTLVHPGRIDTPYNEHADIYVDRHVLHRGMAARTRAGCARSVTTCWLRPIPWRAPWASPRSARRSSRCCDSARPAAYGDHIAWATHQPASRLNGDWGRTDQRPHQRGLPGG